MAHPEIWFSPRCHPHTWTNVVIEAPGSGVVCNQTNAQERYITCTSIWADHRVWIQSYIKSSNNNNNNNNDTKQRSLWHKVVFTQFIQITNSIQHHLCAFQLWNTECLRLENKTKHPCWRENWQNCWIFPVRAAFFILSYNVIKFYGEVSKSLICFYPNVSPPYTNIHIQLFSSTVNIHNPSFTLPTENILYFECLGS